MSDLSLVSLALASLASPDVLARARKIKLFLMDVDGTITDGSVCLISSTSADGAGPATVSEMKIFDAHDGQGLSLAHTMGIQTGFITGRRSPAVAKRAEELKVTFVYLGQAKKTEAFEECVRKAGVTEEEVAYMGDDLPDIPLARRAGLAVSVADGAPELKAVCHYATRRLAGHGTAREVVELILKAQGRWEEAVPLALA
jgi:3-deoxy-D-manno-octulosonate 8-phosphate phosphatase (KDO 8-P phosphatase)